MNMYFEIGICLWVFMTIASKGSRKQIKRLLENGFFYTLAVMLLGCFVTACLWPINFLGFLIRVEAEFKKGKTK